MQWHLKARRDHFKVSQRVNFSTEPTRGWTTLLLEAETGILVSTQEQGLVYSDVLESGPGTILAA